MNLLHLFIEGGFIMWPLLVFSIIIWVVFLEKVWFLRSFSQKFKALDLQLSELARENKKSEILSILEKTPEALSIPYLAILSKGSTDEEKFNQRVARRIKETQTRLKRYLWLLGSIASSAPFIGLFGTVIGIIKSFDSIAQAGKSGFAIVAAGLSEALIATAAGIIVAVIAVLFFNYFQTKIALLNEEFKHKLEDFNDLIN